MDRVTKEAFVNDMHAKLERAQIVVLMNYTGLTVADTNDLRRKMEATDVELRVVKNTLFSHAVQRAGISGLDEFLVGPTGVVIAYGDPVAPVKTLTEFLKGNEKLQVKAAYFGGTVLNLEGVKQLANMPSREQLLAQLLGTLQAPARNLVSVLSAVPRDIVNVLNAYKDKVSGGAQV